MTTGAENVTLTWSMRNWITVVLMVAIMFAFVGTVRAIIVGNLPGNRDATT